MISFVKYSECRTWYVVFDRPRTRGFRWWHLFTGRRFAHCWMFSEAGNGIIKLEPLRWGICATYMDVPVIDAAKEVAESDVTAVISVTVDYRTVPQRVARGPISCVSIIKAVLGVKCLHFTPKMVYKYLCRHEGFVPIKPYVPYVGE